LDFSKRLAWSLIMFIKGKQTIVKE